MQAEVGLKMLQSMQLQKEQTYDGLAQNRLLSLVDLFAGCGGLSLGFENSGFTPVFVSELNKDARDTYLYNRKHELEIINENFSTMRFLCLL